MPEQVILEFVGEASGLKPVTQELSAQEKAFKALNTEAQKSVKEISAKLKPLVSDFDKMSASVKKVGGDTKQLNDAFKQLSQTILQGASKEVLQFFEQFGDELLTTTEKSKSLKAQLKDLKAALAEMELAGDDSSETFIKMSVEAAKLEDQIGDTNARIRAMASDTRTFDLVAEGIRGITAGFSVATSATALFGKENEDLQKALLKVQAAMALATGAQELANIATAKGGIATTAYGYALKAVEAIQKQFAISSAAAWAAATGGVALLLTGVYALVSAFQDADEAADTFAKKRENQAAEEAKIQLQQKQDLIKQLSDSDKEFFDQQEIARRERLANGEDANQVEFDLLTKSIENYQNKVKGYQTGYFNYLQLTEEEEKSRIATFNDFINTAVIARNKIIDDANKDAIKKQEDAGKALGDLMKKQIAEMRFADKAIEEGLSATSDHLQDFIQKIKNNEQFQLEPLITEETVKENKANADQMAEDLMKSIKKAKEENEARLAEEKRITEQVQQFAIQTSQTVISGIFDSAREERQNELDSLITHLEKKKQIELSNAKLTEAEKQAINEKYRKKEAEAKAKAWRADQQAKAEQALINGLLAFTASLATQGYPAGLVTGLLAIASASVEAGLILSKPVPQFAIGTKNAPPGFKWVGEQGPELINDNGGYAIMTNADSMKLLQKYDIPALPNSSFSLPMVDGSVQQMYHSNSTQIDYNKLGNVIADKLRDNPRTIINIDRNGMSINTVEKGKKIEHLNNLYAA